MIQVSRGVGDAFFRWLWENQANQERCLRFPINAAGENSFEEFPTDPRLASFDPNDRKFVAVAVASGMSPVVLNATDADWRDHQQALADNGVHVRQLCPHCLKPA